MPLRLLFNHEHTGLEPNSYAADSSAATVILKLCCPSLVRLDRDMVLRPDLATDWSVEDDARRFTFALRRDVAMQGGRPLDADLVAWNFRRLFDPRVNTLLRADYAGLEEVTAIDRHTVRFRFGESFPAFPHHLAWRTYVTDDRLTQPVGAGPYAVTAWHRGSHVTLRRVPDHPDAGSYAFDELEIRWAPTAEARLAVIRAGGADIVETVPATAAAELAREGLLDSVAVTTPRKVVIAFNLGEPPFDDPRMRRAVAHAVDRDGLRAAFFAGRARAVNGVLPADDPWSVPLDPVPHDPTEARRLVEASGHGAGVTVKVAATAVMPMPRVVARVAAELAVVGIHLDVRCYDDPPWWPAVYLEGHWQMAFQGASARPHPDILFGRDLVTGGSYNPLHYSSPPLDALVAEARRTTGEDRQRALYAEAQRVIHADLPILPLWSADVLAGWNPRLRGFRPHPLGYIELAGVTMEAG